MPPKNAFGSGPWIEFGVGWACRAFGVGPVCVEPGVGVDC